MLALISDTGIIVLVAALALLFGASHLPKLARNIAEAGKEFRKAHAEMDDLVGPGSKPPAAPALEPAVERISLTRAELDALVAARSASGAPAPSATAPNPE